MPGFGEAAVKAAERLVRSGSDPEFAWKWAVREVFPADSTSLEKGCPRGAFLGLCKHGAVEGVRDFYELKDSKNGDYACRAWQALKRDPGLASDRLGLWKTVHADAQNENGQLDVVLALWSRGLLTGSPVSGSAS